MRSHCSSPRRRFASAIIAVIGLGALAWPVGPAGAATKIGETFVPTGTCSPRTRIQTTFPGAQYAAPFAGVITSWSFQSSSGGGGSPLRLKVGRSAGGGNFTIVGESDNKNIPDADAFFTFPARISVQAGDVIGTTAVPASVFLCMRSATGFVVSQGPFAEDVAVGAPAVFTPANDQQLDVSAMLEPDSDSDGFGDETQDKCVGTAGAANGCPSTVTINKLRLKGETRVKVTATVPGAGTLEVGSASDPALASKAARSLKAVTRTLRSTSRQRVRLRLKLTKSAIKRLRDGGRLKLKVKAVYTPPGGPAGFQTKRKKLKS
jgi:hypothetical protein